MATQTGYIAINRNDFWWAWENARTVISRYTSNGYASDTASWPNNTSDSQVLKLASDEYPTGVSFSGNILSLGYNVNVTLALCDSNGNNSHTLNTAYCEGPTTTPVSEGGTGYTEYHPVALSKYNVSSVSWTNLAGCILALYRPNNEQYAKNTVIRNTATINVTTGYLTRTVTVSAGTGGSATISNSSLSRGQSATVTITCNAHYVINSVTATGGNLTRTSGNVYTFTMSSPAVNTTISVTFSQLNQIATVGEKIYAAWYNE